MSRDTKVCVRLNTGEAAHLAHLAEATWRTKSAVLRLLLRLATVHSECGLLLRASECDGTGSRDRNPPTEQAPSG